MPNCRSCGAEIVWMTTTQGKYIPVDADSVNEDDVVDTDDPTEYDPEAGHVSHFVTCPDANEWSRR